MTIKLLVGLVVVAGLWPAAAQAADCPAVTIKGVRIVELGDGLGCTRGASLASRTVRHDGFLKSGDVLCRWGQGGTKPIKRGGKTFYSGFCANVNTNAQASFLARDRIKGCHAGVRARYIDCPTARKTYRQSVKVAMHHPGTNVVRFRYAGHRWKCRPGHAHVWTCTAKNDVLVSHRP
jgi:hypothetical protein